MRDCSVPEAGDVVVRQDDRHGGPVYALSRTPGPDQYYLRSRREAVAQAITFARMTGTCAWFADSPTDLVLLAAYVPPTPIRRVRHGAAAASRSV
jgi:hypothetical protein